MFSFLTARLSANVIFYGGIALLLVALLVTIRIQTVNLDNLRQQLGTAEATIAAKQGEIDFLNANLADQQRRHTALAKRHQVITRETAKVVASIGRAKTLPTAPEQTAEINAQHREVWNQLQAGGE